MAKVSSKDPQNGLAQAFSFHHLDGLPAAGQQRRAHLRSVFDAR
jgi:hypothetical protein